MFIWNINGLIQQLKTNSVSAFDQALYYFAILIFPPLISFHHEYRASSLFDTHFSTLHWLTIIVLGCGVAYCYKINKQNDNKDFILRMITLNFVATTRFVILTFLIYVLTAFLVMCITPNHILEHIKLLEQNSPLKNMVFTMLYVLIMLYEAMYFWYVGKQFKKMALHTQVITH